MVGTVFVSEGIQKFLFPESLGAGRFEQIGLPAAPFLGPFLGCVEIGCALAVLAGFCTRIVSVPLIIIMLTALSVTKSPVFAEKGFWEFLHASRTDWSMLLGSIFLWMKGGGKWSLDRIIWLKQSAG